MVNSMVNRTFAGKETFISNNEKTKHKTRRDNPNGTLSNENFVVFEGNKE